tara:strand:+ start:581 stop:955 length:375 start_codon:yes stop_codon:yes gene_type:complete
VEEKHLKGLSPIEKYVIVNKGTESPFSGEYNEHYEEGIYSCRACGSELYKSDAKFNSGCGWPSFDKEIEGAVTRHQDNSAGMIRVEICCSNCDGHLGHVFEGEGFTSENTRHCVNSLSIKFNAK